MTRSFPKSQTVVRSRSNLILAVLAATLNLGALAACSSVPDAVNPVEWYRSAAGMFENDEEHQERAAEEAARTTTALPGTDQAYPNLSTVPDRPQPTPSDERGKAAQGLAADRENARYAESDPQRAVSSGLNPAAAPAGQVSSMPLAAPMPAPAPAPAVAAPQAPQPAPSVSQSAVPLPPPVYQSAPATPPASSQPSPQPTGTGDLLGMTQTATIYFTNNSTAIDANDRRALNTLAQSYKDTGGSLRVVGFASPGGTSSAAKLANFRIASQRAEVVAKELAGMGVPRARIAVSSATANGGGDPALERRVEIALDY